MIEEGCETGPTVYSLNLTRLESLTICESYYKGSTKSFSAVILRPRVLVRPKSRPTAWQLDDQPT